MPRIFRFLCNLLLLLASAGAGAETILGHQIDILFDPDRGTLTAVDTLTLPPERDTWDFFLHAGMDPQVSKGYAELTRTGTENHLEHFRLRVKTPGPVRLSYSGRIRHELEDIRESIGRSRQWSRGTIGSDGIVLDGYSGWYPRFPDTLQSFSLSVSLPDEWIAVSQGTGPEISKTPNGLRIGWREDKPQDDIYLMAAPFARYSRPTPNGESQVYLRQEDQALADRYLAATSDYLALYSKLIGPYPYAKFALVENFWETGYGMPSFTLLGPQVIRLPFIIHTSYPHEVLHNWWGNGVYVDYDTGNWSEGLTAYLADHLLKEQQGQGADYRRDTLKSYEDYVREGKDFPIRAFRGRHGSASQAIGYGKTLMMLHMLRRDLGDGIFVASLQRFYRDNLFRSTGFDDLRRAFEQESGRDLAGYFDQWTGRTGAPKIALNGVSAVQAGEDFRLRGSVEQVQEEAPFPLTVPLVVHLENGEIFEHQMPLSERAADFDLTLTARPVCVAADPRFDLFRQLVPGESPATLSALFGAETGLIVLPSAAPADLADGFRQLAAAWTSDSGGWDITKDDELQALPGDRPVWLLGWSNRFLGDLRANQHLFDLDQASKTLTASGDKYEGAGISAALVRNRGGQPVGWVAAGNPDALPGLARKLPHYGKYSYLVFEGQAPNNRLKGQWPGGDSSLTVWLTEARPMLETPPAPPLTAVLE